MANNPLQITELDFDTIKENLKTYLRSKPQYTDFDFEGSNFAVLIDLLAYNTYYNAYYLNMINNESFLDTALLRNSVVSKAKELGYTPRSVTGAEAIIDLSIEAANVDLSQITIPKYTEFTTSVDGQTLTFSTDQAYVATLSGSFYIANDVTIREGSLLTHSYDGDVEEFLIPNANVDIDTIEVVVAPGGGGSNVVYTRATSLYGLDGNSEVFFIEPADESKYRIVFGDDVFGAAISNSDTVYVTYKVAHGDTGNKANSFTVVGSIASLPNVDIVTTSAATGGSDQESIESVKYIAPRYFQAQERAVTAKDFEVLVLANFPEVKSVRAYGGELADPPYYGRVYVAVKPENQDFLTDSKKAIIEGFLEQRTALSIDPIVIDPDIMHLELDVTVYYNPNNTNDDEMTISTLVKSVVETYVLSVLDRFNGKLKASQLGKTIDNTHNSIIGSYFAMNIKKTVIPQLNTSQQIIVNFNNELTAPDTHERHAGHVPTVWTTAFTHDGRESFIKDDGTGVLYVYYINSNGQEVISVTDAGSVDYTTGRVVISELDISSYDGDGLVIYAKPEKLNIVSAKDQLITINEEDITIIMSPETD